MKIKWILPLLTVLIWNSSNSYANPLTQYFQSWNRLAFNKPSGKRIKYAGFIDVRFGNRQNTYHSSVYNLSAGYKLPHKILFWLGYQFANTLNSRNNRAQFENRIYQQLNWRYHKLSARTRVEERFFTHRAETLVRLRLRLGYSFSQKKILYGQPFIDNELLFNLVTPTWVGNSHLDQNRLRLGIKNKLNNKNMLEVGYMNLYRKTRNGHDMYHVLFLTLTFI